MSDTSLSMFGHDTESLRDRLFDVLVIGGGIAGAGIAYDAAQRGLSVALVERSDFCSETSAACFNIIHGGLRYLQQFDLRRLRTSAAEQAAVLRIAPHLTAPLPVLVPCYGFGKKGCEALRLATRIYEFLATERNRDLPPHRHLPPASQRSRGETLRIAPNIRGEGLRGGMMFSDAVVSSSERLTLAVLRSAARAGATVLNYAEAVDARERSDGMYSYLDAVTVRFRRTGLTVPIRSRWVVNAAGAQRESVARTLLKRPTTLPQRSFVKAMQLVLAGRVSDVALALDSNHEAGDSVFRRGGRSYFVYPMGETTWCGTFETTCQTEPVGRWRMLPDERDDFLRELGRAYPWDGFASPEILHSFGGFISLKHAESENGSYLVDREDRINRNLHSGRTGLRVRNFISVAAVKFTTFRHLAEVVTDMISESIEAPTGPCRTAGTPLIGGDEAGIRAAEFELASRMRRVRNGDDVGGEGERRLLAMYGSEVTPMLERIGGDDRLLKRIHPAVEILGIELLWAFEREGAKSLADALLRRTTVAYRGILRKPERHIVVAAAAELFGWTEERREEESDELDGLLGVTS